MRVLLALVLAVAFIAFPASALAATGSISGDVADYVTNARLADMCVQATRSDGGSSSPGATRTGADGHFSLTGLEPGEYRVSVSDCRATPEYGPSEFSQPIAVASGQDSCCYWASMRRLGAISGRTLDYYRHPIAGGLCAEALDEKGAVAGRAETGSDGTYVIERLREGTYTVRFVDCTSAPYWETQWYFHDYRGSETILAVGVRAGETTTGINADYMRAIPAIEGTITEEGSGAPIANYCARIWQGEFYVPGYWHSDANGHYRVERNEPGALPPGAYQIQFEHCGMGDASWLAEWYDDSYRKETSTWIQVEERGTKIANVSLARGAQITGTVTLHDVRPTGLPGLCVQAFGADSGGLGPPVGGTDRLENGTYAIQGLPGGDYKVRFARCHESDRIPLWATKWWDDAPGFAGARTVSVPRGGSVSGVDATVELAGTAPPPTARAARCVVPKLEGLTLARAARRLRAAGCRLGRTTRVRANAHRGTVVGTRARAGRRLPGGSRVAVLVAR